MRHLKKGRKFHREKGQRKALLRNLVNNLIVQEKIETTVAKAKEIKPLAEKLTTLAKKQDLAVLRILLSRLPKSGLNFPFPKHALFFRRCFQFLSSPFYNRLFFFQSRKFSSRLRTISTPRFFSRNSSLPFSSSSQKFRGSSG